MFMNRKQELLFIFMSFIITGTLITASTLFAIFVETPHKGIILATLIIANIFSIIGFLMVYLWQLKNKFEYKKSFEHYVEEMVSEAGVGVLIFNTVGIIIYASQFLIERFNSTLIGKNIDDLDEKFTELLFGKDKEFNYINGDITYEVKIDTKNNAIIFKDISSKMSILNQYKSEKTIIGELEIDNFQEYQNILPEEELFQIQSTIIKLLDSLVEEYNVIYRQYVNGKFIIISDEETLTTLADNNFDMFTKLSKSISISGVKLTVSAGFGAESSVAKDLMSLAKEAISRSHARGGGQVTIAYPNKDYKYFGATSESVAVTSRVKVSQISKILAAKLKDNKIKNVLIYGHSVADLDALGSAYGLYEMAKTFKKKAHIVLGSIDKTSKQALKHLGINKKEVFLKPTQISKFTKASTVVILTDVADPKRTDNEDALKGYPQDNLFVFDHHRVTSTPAEVLKTNTYIDSSASSASEIISEVMQFSKINIKLSKIGAQLLLSGIYLDTKQFEKQTSSRTFAAASWLESFGAEASISSDLLKLPEEQTKLINKILNNLIEVKPGFYMASYDGEAESDVVSVAADEILRTSGRKAAFVIAKVPGKKQYKMSARSIDQNVQIIAEAVGGGGHFGASAAVSEESLEIFKDNIIQAIVSVKNESNNNKRM